MEHTAGWVLGVDLGTSSIAAAWAPVAGGDVETLPLEHSANAMPSAVHVGDGAPVVGNAALNLAEGSPERLLRHPKRSADRESVPLDGRHVGLVEIMAAQLSEVLDRARRRLGDDGPRVLALSHPEAWSTAQKERLREAAVRAGVRREAVHLVSEPVAAARYYTGRRPVPDGATVAVFDFGGGTLDVAVVRVLGGRFEVLTAGGDNSLGGWNLDDALRRWVVGELEEEHPEAAAWLAGSPPWSARRAVDESVRRAKESLSEAPSAVVTIPAPGGDIRLGISRTEFEAAISGDVDRAVRLTTETAADARRRGAGPPVALYLTGGSSRVPLVHDRLAAIAPVAVLDDPKLVVAKGAVLSVRGDRSGPVAPVAGPVHGPAAPAPVASATRSGSAATGERRRGGRVGAFVLGGIAGAVVLVLLVVVGVYAAYRYVGADDPNFGQDPEAPLNREAGDIGEANDPSDVAADLPASLARISTCTKVDGTKSTLPDLGNEKVAECTFTTSDFGDPPADPRFVVWRDIPNAKVMRDWMVNAFGPGTPTAMLRDTSTQRAMSYEYDGHARYYATDIGSGLGIEAENTFTSLTQVRIFDRIVAGG